MSRPESGRRRGLQAHGHAVLGVLAIVQVAMGGPVQFTPSVDEAVDRGVIYEMTAFPQEFGYIGFGTGFSDLDGDGDPDIIVLGAGVGEEADRIGIFENDGTGYFIDRSRGNGIRVNPDALC